MPAARCIDTLETNEQLSSGYTLTIDLSLHQKFSWFFGEVGRLFCLFFVCFLKFIDSIQWAV